jgi:hypothetical protein
MDDMQKIEHLQRRSSELLAEMRRLERENQKNKKRGDNLQKEKDANRTELSKTVQLREKLEKLCRELQKDNNKFKVDGIPLRLPEATSGLTSDFLSRMRIRRYRTRTSIINLAGMINMLFSYLNWKDIKRKKTILVSKLSIWEWTSC